MNKRYITSYVFEKLVILKMEQLKLMFNGQLILADFLI